MDTEKCKTCKGAGTIGKRRDVCGTCKGSGSVLVGRDAAGNATITPAPPVAK